jgi:OFA family oxalate/formate antiporter-like MFS transporter
MTPGMTPVAASAKTRWVQLVLGIVCMSMLANLQYGWTMFVQPMHERHGWSIAAIQVAFSIFIVTETWPQFALGWVVDRYGPRLAVAFGGILIGASWIIDSIADSLTLLYVAAVVGGIGVCAVAASTFGNAFKWFPDKRGLAVGLTSAGFGAGAALTVVPIQHMIEADSYEAAFFNFGLLQGGVIFLVAWAMRAPKPGEAPPPRDQLVRMVPDSTPPQMLRSGIFWIVLVMFLFASIGGVMATAQLGPIARDYGIDKLPVSLFGLTLPALTFALSIDRVLNGITRPFFGFISDHIGRENTLFIAFGLEAIGIWALGTFGHDPLSFVLLTGCVFFAWGEIYTVFAALLTDIFGTRYAATNYGILYCGKGIAALLVPLGSLLAQYTGSWHSVFLAAAIMNALTAVGALLVVKPMRLARSRAHQAETPSSLVAVAAQRA